MKNNHTRQYLRDSTICLRLWSCKNFIILRKILQVALAQFSLSKQYQTSISKSNSFSILTNPQKNIPLKTITILFWVES